jgi:chromosome segregation ATPase
VRFRNVTAPTSCACPNSLYRSPSCCTTLGVSARTVRNYIQRGDLAAKEEHEGITDRYLVSVDSLYALRDKRKNEARGKRNGRRVSEAAEIQGNDTTELLRETIARLETRAEQNAELRTRLQLTAQAESTLRDALDRERERADRAERRLEELEARLAEPVEAPEPRETAADAPEGVLTSRSITAAWRRAHSAPGGVGGSASSRPSPRFATLAAHALP